jgi:sensor histidine kinase YesM
MNNPLTKLPSFIVYLAIWVVFIIIDYAFFTGTFKLEARYVLLDSIISCFIFLWLGLGFWFPAKFMSLDENSLVKILIQHLCAAFAASLIWVSLTYFILVLLWGVSAEYKMFVDGSLIWRLLSGIFLYIVIVSLYYIYIYYSNFQSKLVKESELRALIKEAELRTLKYQINPHFIFNSLNSISSLTMINPDKAREMTIKLSGYLRATLANNEKQFNYLGEEIENCRLYLDIEKIRFENKFEYIESIPEECKKLQVPNMILQPLFENAIKHGVYEALDKIIISLKCSIKDQYLNIKVENDFDKESISRRGQRIGLNNIKERLRLIYNQDNLLVVKNTAKNGNNESENKGLFSVSIFIPIDNTNLSRINDGKS